MPDLAQSLEGYDLRYLQIVADLWGVEFNAAEFHQGLDKLVPVLLDPQLVEDVVKSLPIDTQEAVEDLLRNDGRMTWSLFIRRYGEVREMGPGRRDRARPYLDPVSPAEILWYRALLGRAFFDTPSGPEEFAYIPDDLLPLISTEHVSSSQTFGRAALSAEREHPLFVYDRVLNDACTLLAALRMGLPESEVPLLSYPGSSPLTTVTLKALLMAANLLDEGDMPQPEQTRQFLELSRGEALAQLTINWLNSGQFNELALLPELVLEGEWANEPLPTRRTILNLLSTVPQESWWNIESFVTAVHQQQPDFQRPAGDYDSWFIRHTDSGEYLRGFEHWDQVEGQLLRFMIAGPLHWLGILDLGAPGEGQPVRAFRFSKWSRALLQGETPDGLPIEDQKIQARSDARLNLSPLVPRTVRYQIARFSHWEGLKRGIYLYKITPASLERASQQGLRSEHLLTLLRKHADALPPSLVKAIERWVEHGGQVRIEEVQVLRLSSPEILGKLRASRAARFLGDPLGPTAVIVKPGAREKVLAALAEMGYLGEISVDE